MKVLRQGKSVRMSGRLRGNRRSFSNLKIGQRGRAEIVIETFGKPCHSANPEKGINAVYKMAKVIGAIRTLVPTHHPVLGDGILELTDIKSALILEHPLCRNTAGPHMTGVFW